MTKFEQETIFSYNQAEENCHCYTCDQSLIRKLDKLCQKDSRVTEGKSGDGYKEYNFPKKWLSVKLPRQLTEEKRAELRNRAMKYFHNGEAQHD